MNVRTLICGGVFTMKETEYSASDVLWELFRTTGDINYYELYSRLKNGKKDGRNSHTQR